MIVQSIVYQQFTESAEEAEEHHRLMTSLKKKNQRLNQEIADFRIHVDEQLARNLELEKKQRK